MIGLKKWVLAGFASVALMTSLTANADTLKTEQISVIQQASAINVAYRSQEQIRSYIASHPFQTTGDVTFTKAPDMTSPYADRGDISLSDRQNGLNALNTVRYIAGLGEVSLNSYYNEQAQTGAYINALNGYIDHYPIKPSGIEGSLYNAGYPANNRCNLAAGSVNLAKSVLAYMDDSDARNISVLGHRRWCLSPEMTQTGFGQVNNRSTPYWYFSNMYVMDNSAANWSTDKTGIAWPARNMPIEFFGENQAWSYSPGKSIANPSAVKVTLTRMSDGRVWTFGSGSKDFYVNDDRNSASGSPGCVIFRPSGVVYKAGDVFTVHIDGLGAAVDYTVNFFDAAPSGKPSAVTGFRAAAYTNSVYLSWNRVSGADSYQIDIYKNGKWSMLAKTTGTSYTASGLSSGTGYQFRIFAFKGSQYSMSARVSATTTRSASSGKPDAVTGFRAAAYTNSVYLSWNRVSGADSYQIDIYKNGKWSMLAKTTGTSYTATGLSSGTGYQFRIFAFKGSQYSMSARVSATTTRLASSGKPDAVTGFRAAAYTNSVYLSWNRVSGADSYQIDIYKNGKWSMLAKTTGTSFTATGLSSETGYQFRIFAFKGSQYSMSARVSATTTRLASSGKPDAVTGFRAAAYTNSVYLSWNKVSGADSYQIDIYKNGKWSMLAKTTGTSFTATGLSSGTGYQFRIFAFRGSQYSTSARVSATTTRLASSGKPSAVTGFRAAAYTNSVYLFWNKVSGADSYQIDIYKNGKWSMLAKTTGTSFTATGLSSGTGYQFRIFAFKGSQYSTSSRVSATTR